MIPRRVPLSEAVAPARAEHAEAVDACVAWSATLGRPVDPDVVALLHAAEDEHRRDGDEGWDRSELYSFLRSDLWNWCTLANCDYPDEELPETLWLWLHHRHVSGRWHPDGESLHELLKVLLCYTELGFDGRPVPGGKTRRIVPCECYASRRYPPPPGDPPSLEDLEAEADAECGPPDRRHAGAAAGATGPSVTGRARRPGGRRRSQAR